jgi:hypothetical protein
MITLECNYSKKIGLPGYSSHQFSITLRTESAALTKSNQRAPGCIRSSKTASIHPSRKSASSLVRTATVQPQPSPTAMAMAQATATPTPGIARINNTTFFFRYVQAIKKPKDTSLFIGGVVHLVLQTWNKARWRKIQIDMAGLKSQFDQHWQKHLEEEKQNTWSLLDTYFKATPIQASEKVEALEVPVEADLAKHGLPTLIGVLDLVREGGKIVDFGLRSEAGRLDGPVISSSLFVRCLGFRGRFRAG